MLRKGVAAMLLPIALFAISSISNAIEVGDKAPDFDLASTQGGRFKLSNLTGKKNVVIEFYVIDFTPT